MEVPRIVVTVEGGVIQAIEADVPVSVLVLDLDVDGSDVERLARSVSGDPCFKSLYSHNDGTLDLDPLSVNQQFDKAGAD